MSDPLSLVPLAGSFGVELRGLHVGAAAPAEAVEDFLAALHQHHVVLIRDVPNDPAAQVAFSRKLGPLERHSSPVHIHPQHPEIFCVGNYVGEGIRANFATGVEQWHADSSFRATPSAASLFYGAICPPEGGETWFLDAEAAYADLPAETRGMIDGLTAVHDLATLSVWNARHTPGRPTISEETRRQFPPMPQPLVRVHPVTGARSLFLCPAVISHIEGMDAEAGSALIAALMQHAAQERYVYRHRWQAGDLVAWDNRSVLHTASLFDHTRYTRLMYRTTVAGSA